MTDQRILMGVIGRPHGVRGLVHVHSYAEADLAGYGPLLDEQGRAWSLAWRGEGIAQLSDPAGMALADRTAAERLVNTRLYIERERLAEPGDDDFYWSDLVGMQAVGADGAALGRVGQVHDYGAGPSLEIVGGGKSLIVPFTKACVPAVSLASKTMTVILPDEVDLSLPSGEGRDEGSDTLTQPSSEGRGLFADEAVRS